MKKTKGILWPLALALMLGQALPAAAQTDAAQTTAEPVMEPAGNANPAEASPAPADTAPAEPVSGETATAEASSAEAVPTIPVDTGPEPPLEQPGFFSSLFSDFDVSFGGFLRTETAVSLTKDVNPANQLGNAFNGRAQHRQAYVPPGYLPAACNGIGLPPPVCGITGAVVTTWTQQAFPATLAGDAGTDGLRGTFSANTDGSLTGQPIRSADDRWNLQMLRGELEMSMKFGPDFSIQARVRALYDRTPYEQFDARSVAGTITTGGGGIQGGDPRLYAGKPNYFDYITEGGRKGHALEWTGRNYQIYLPTLIADFNRGPLNLRIGNQQIAWGQALFFRQFDVVDGLDLRRHLVLDYAQEEYADERVPALGARISWQFTDEVLADAFIQKFQPTVYPNPNTQYNVIPVAFTVHDLFYEGGYDKKFNYGLRFKGNYGQWGFQAAAVRRYNPDGVFRWTASGVDRNLPCGSADFSDNTIACRVEFTLNQEGKRSGALLAQTAFEVAPGGVYSANEWFNYAAKVRLAAIDGLNASITDFPATTDLFASPVAYQSSCADENCEAYNELNTFFIAAGGSLRGHIAREYFVENVFALGASYVVEGEPGGVLDQLIINLESSYTPKRTFTPLTLTPTGYPKANASVTALVMEKYYRFSQDFPATYFVFQYMHRNVDDLFGRLLSGYGGTETTQAPGVKNADYAVFAFQQPFPQDVYRAAFALLYDPRGSILVQPGLRWKPNREWQVDGFYTYINGALGGANPNETLLSTLDFADEFTLRLTYQF